MSEYIKLCKSCGDKLEDNFCPDCKFCKSCVDKLEDNFCHDCDYEDIYGGEVDE